jgi:phosphohistidine phosphatase
MRLLVIRHAIAGDREAFAATGRDDASRPLTNGGKRKMRRAARGLRCLVPRIDALVASPLVRAQETAEIVRDVYAMDRVDTAAELEPERALDEVTAGLARFEDEVVAIVGHEPQLSRLITYLLAGVDRSGVQLKKGGACLLEFDDRPRANAGELLWLVRPSILRDLAG